MNRYFFILLAVFLLSGSSYEEIKVEDGQIQVIVPELPCFDGWQFDYTGAAVINPETGAAIRCIEV